MGEYYLTEPFFDPICKTLKREYPKYKGRTFIAAERRMLTARTSITIVPGYVIGEPFQSGDNGKCKVQTTEPIPEQERTEITDLIKASGFKGDIYFWDK